MDETFKVSVPDGSKGEKNLDFSIDGTLYLVGDAAIDDRSQLIRTKGELDTNAILFLDGTLRYVFLTGSVAAYGQSRHRQLGSGIYR